MIFYKISQAQLNSGQYKGENYGSRLTINPDSTATYYFRYETALSFEYKCRIIKKTDSTFQLENLNSTNDKIILNNKNNGSSILVINFFTVNRANQNTSVKIEYEIISCINMNNNKSKCICFFYNHRLYRYYLPFKTKEVNIFIDIDNSFFITNWKVNGDKLIPYINGTEAEKWKLQRNK